ncbi:MAG: competence/damage-inducible protein A [Desulfobacterales bacterium]|nr:competence/damage-inducible protein A [Desulfobacterales bacterium]
MIAEIIATGDEIRTGALVDRNSAYIADKIENIGIAVTRHICVGDDLAQLRTVFRETAARADIAIVTGGLGPTVDDLTARAAAEAKGVELQLDPAALEVVTAFFEKRNFPMGPRNRKQAFLPETATCIPNPVGTAPGFDLRIDQCLFFFLPGVPHEMKRMLDDAILPAIVKLRGKKHLVARVKTICSFGLGESEVDEQLSEFPAKFPNIQLGLRASFPVIQVKLYGRDENRQKLEEQLAAAEKRVCNLLGDTVFSTEGYSMARALGQLLAEKQATVAVAESCTGGLIASQLTDVSGSSDYFLFSGVTYSNSAKKTVLGVPRKTLEQCGAVDPETARHMALGARKVSGADYAIATSGIAGPGGGTDEKPVGTLCVGLATPQTSRGFRYNFPFRDRGQNKHLFAVVAMDKLRKELLKN